MKAIGIVMRKELYRVFSDKKLIFGLYIMPAMLVLGMYFLMGIMASSMMQDRESHEPTVLVYGVSDTFQSYISERKGDNQPLGSYIIGNTTYHISFTEEKSELEAGKDLVYSGDLDLILAFPEGFDEQIEDYKSGADIPDLQTFYNPSEDYSNNARNDMLVAIIEPYRKELLGDRIGDLEQLTIFTIDETNEDSVIQNDNKAQGKLFGMIIPYMITILLFAGAMSLGADSFAGEKERGTMAALLMLPIKRSHIVYGKLFALMILSGFSALVYGGAMIFAMPLLYRTLGAMLGQDLNFPPGQMIMMLTLIVTLVFLYVALIALCATFAKNMKEGSTYIMPAYMAVIAVGVMSMFKEEVADIQYLIPFYGSTMALKNIFTFEVTATGFLLAALSNLVTGALFAWLTAKLFHSEKIMFNA